MSSFEGASPNDPECQGYFALRGNQARQLGDYPKSAQRIIRLQQGQCPWCGQSLFNGEPIHIHHKQPRHLGGTNHASNLMALHRVCHQQVHR